MNPLFYPLITMLFSYSTLFAQWTDNGANLTTSDNVGIGIPSPEKKLEVSGPMRIHGDLATLYFYRATNPTDIAKIRYEEANQRFIIGANTKDIIFQNKPDFAESMRITSNGNVGIGTTNPVPGYRLTVVDGIITEKVRVAVNGTANWSDYVFENDYKLKTLSEVESFVKENKHLPGIPSAKEMVKEGLDVAQMDAKLLEKIEELTLYTIEQQKLIEVQQKQLQSLQRQVNELKQTKNR